MTTQLKGTGGDSYKSRVSSSGVRAPRSSASRSLPSSRRRTIDNEVPSRVGTGPESEEPVDTLFLRPSHRTGHLNSPGVLLGSVVKGIHESVSRKGSHTKDVQGTVDETMNRPSLCVNQWAHYL